MAWQIRGEYMETCNCAFLCPCIVTNLQGQPTEGDCKAALAMHIDEGSMDGVSLDGVDFIAILQSKGPMGAGDMTVGLVVDAAASDAQVQAITAIASGAAGGPLAMMAPLVGRFAGVERASVSIRGEGGKWSARAGELIDQACEGVLNMEGRPLVLDNASHPVSSRIALARAARSMFKVFGIEWKDETGTRNAHYAPFSWAG
ncbi:DUF1326 domain-containing protein [Ramlibacter alkalitolerans]|uniref:DUF1326 domain-containing protein n=1 Tax=Ramlibacter alkalitolerans TaxID=2039631 RepID=A0ABS1JUX1_9BURK|nr:DUF1326 domain-containing protein [Ramlibacter alkalitolerans]MBL0427997.1 DUF1326 domain-containing protein [Ramlibacter alkalitolerans]